MGRLGIQTQTAPPPRRIATGESVPERARARSVGGLWHPLDCTHTQTVGHTIGVWQLAIAAQADKTGVDTCAPAVNVCTTSERAGGPSPTSSPVLRAECCPNAAWVSRLFFIGCPLTAGND